MFVCSCIIGVALELGTLSRTQGNLRAHNIHLYFTGILITGTLATEISIEESLPPLASGSFILLYLIS
jgi:hypothetical protein